MCTEDVFTTHLPKYTDSFLLLIKAIMMVGRVTDFNVRGNLSPTAPSKFQDPFELTGFADLDRLVYNDFLENLPSMFKMTSANELPGSHGENDLGEREQEGTRIHLRTVHGASHSRPQPQRRACGWGIRIALFSI
jgi:hypothetical protein